MSSINRPIASCIRALWNSLGIVLLGWLLIEAILRAYLLIWPEKSEIPDFRSAEVFAGKPWAQELIATMDKARVQWSPYVYWRSTPTQSNFLNVDAGSHRRTIDAEFINSKVERALKIYFFGGSTMWGVGVPDALTIPSLVATILKSHDISYTISNYGEHGYVSTQELILLEKLLRDGERPDLVVFYDGVNDTYAAFQNRVAGLTHNESRRESEFNLLNDSRINDLLFESVKSNLMRLKSVVLLRRALLALRSKRDSDDRPMPSKAIQDLVSIYETNQQIVRTLGNAFEFYPLFFWQPIIYRKQQLSPHESAIIAHQQQLLIDVARAAYAEVGQKTQLNARPDFFNLSDIFRQISEPLFIDFCHLADEGNRRVAETIAAALIARIKKQPSA